ncbi:hypothetical protein V1477_005752 [Vespula maculifrons]|uniref:Uncharacterized protein n=1 Tax=Vespula maculifrons TaxID=7453 RepID=A0ABD2CMZ0_VESMC
MEMKSIFVIDAILIIILLLLAEDTLHGLKGQIQEKQRRKLFQYFRIIANNQNCLLVVITSKEDFMMAARVFFIDEWDIRSLAVLKNFALLNIRHLMCQIVKSAEEADAAHEFITNLPNDTALDRECRRVVYKALGNSIQGRNIVSYCPCMQYEEEKEEKTFVLDDEIWKSQYGARGTAIRGGGRDLLHSKVPTASGFSWSVYAILLRMICQRAKFQCEVSLASKISPQFYDCLFTPSNITASYEAYSRAIAEKPSDRCDRTSFLNEFFDSWSNMHLFTKKDRNILRKCFQFFDMYLLSEI